MLNWLKCFASECAKIYFLRNHWACYFKIGERSPILERELRKPYKNLVENLSLAHLQIVLLKKYRFFTKKLFYKNKCFRRY